MNFFKSILRITKATILSILLICLVLFMVNNRGEISISLSPIPFNVETRVFLVMIFFFVFGMLFGIIACSQNLIKSAVSNFRQKRTIKKLEQQNTK